MFQDPEVSDFRANDAITELENRACSIVPSVFEGLSDYVNEYYEKAYLQTLFKNLSKCRKIDIGMINKSVETKVHAQKQLW